jgi:hypothetical protein
MEIFLSSESSIKEINKEFTKFFPCLKLEFYPRKHKPGETSLLEHRFSERTSLKEINKNFVPGMIKFNLFDSVADLEQRFQKHFDLSIQVFRRTGEIWVETVQTDNLSLQVQNHMGHIPATPQFNVHTLFL